MAAGKDTNTARILRGYVDTPGGQVHYRRSGLPGRPVIGFFHQTASSGRMFELVMRELGARYDCYAFDTPGFGQSWQQPADVPSVRWLAERLIEAVDALGIGDLVLCGHHTGGCIALEIALAIPARTRALSIIGPVYAHGGGAHRVREGVHGAVPAGCGRRFPADRVGVSATDRCRELRRPAHRRAHRSPDCRHAMPLAFGAVWRQDMFAGLRLLRAPLQFMCSKDDVLWPMFGARL